MWCGLRHFVFVDPVSYDETCTEYVFCISIDDIATTHPPSPPPTHPPTSYKGNLTATQAIYSVFTFIVVLCFVYY